MKTGPITPIFARRRNGGLYIKRLDVWIWTRTGWRAKKLEQIPKKDKSRFNQRIREGAVWPWPTDDRALCLLKAKKLRRATGYEQWTMGALPKFEQESDNETDESDESIIDETDEV